MWWLVGYILIGFAYGAYTRRNKTHTTYGDLINDFVICFIVALFFPIIIFYRFVYYIYGKKLPWIKE